MLFFFWLCTSKSSLRTPNFPKAAFGKDENAHQNVFEHVRGGADRELPHVMDRRRQHRRAVREAVEKRGRVRVTSVESGAWGG